MSPWTMGRRAGLAAQSAQDIGQLGGDAHHPPWRQPPLAQRDLLQVLPGGALHHQDRLVTHPLEGDQPRHPRMGHLLQHEGLLLEAVLQRLGQVDPGELEDVLLAAGGEAGEHEPVGALADQLDPPIAQLLELGLAQRHPLPQLAGILMAQQVDRLVFRNIELLQRRLGHDAPSKIASRADSCRERR